MRLQSMDWHRERAVPFFDFIYYSAKRASLIASLPGKAFWTAVADVSSQEARGHPSAMAQAGHMTSL
jgi:hypothetical protein